MGWSQRGGAQSEAKGDASKARAARGGLRRHGEVGRRLREGAVLRTIGVRYSRMGATGAHILRQASVRPGTSTPHGHTLHGHASPPRPRRQGGCNMQEQGQGRRGWAQC